MNKRTIVPLLSEHELDDELSLQANIVRILSTQIIKLPKGSRIDLTIIFDEVDGKDFRITAIE